MEAAKYMSVSNCFFFLIIVSHHVDFDFFLQESI